jgi:regulatory protein
VTSSRRSSTRTRRWSPSRRLPEAGPIRTPDDIEASADSPGLLFDADEDRRLQRALEIAYAYINRRERTESEVRGELERKGISAPIAETIVTRVREERLVDDRRFAGLFVTDKRELEHWGRERIRRGLLSRGIDRETSEWALDAADDTTADEKPETELDRAVALLRRRFPSPPQDRRERERALGVLLRKGYESSLALDALAAHGRDD